MLSWLHHPLLPAVLGVLVVLILFWPQIKPWLAKYLPFLGTDLPVSPAGEPKKVASVDVAKGITAEANTAQQNLQNLLELRASLRKCGVAETEIAKQSAPLLAKVLPPVQES